jgi:predicted dehydrogenase
MRVLIIGLGSAGRRHLANLRVVAPDAEVAVWHQQAQPGTAVPSDRECHLYSLEEALGFQPDAALVCSPSSLHVDNALPFAQTGVHLLVEKPLAHQSVGVEELLKTCRSHESVLLVGYNLRFEASLVALRNALVEGRIGRPLHLRAEVGQYLPDWRGGTDYRQGVTAQSALGGGALLELSHELDYARWLMGEAEEVSAFTARLGDLDIDVEDTAEVSLRYSSGALGSVHLDMIRRTPLRYCSILGSDGSLTWDALKRQTTIAAPGSDAPEMVHAGDTANHNAYQAELAHFLDCVADGSKPAVTGEDGLRAVQLVEAAKQASRDGMTVRL